MNLIIDTLDGLQKETAENTKKLVDTVNGVDEMLETIKKNYTAAEAVLRSNSENLELLNDICGGDAKKRTFGKGRLVCENQGGYEKGGKTYNESCL